MDHSDKLKDTGLKATLARVKLLELFERSEKRHLSAEDVYQLLKGQGIDIGLATVYRSLAQFEQAGLLRRSQLGADRAIFELNDGGMRHGHLVSLTDSRVHEFVDAEIEAKLAQIADENGLELDDYVITVYGRAKSK